MRLTHDAKARRQPAEQEHPEAKGRIHWDEAQQLRIDRRERRKELGWAPRSRHTHQQKQ